MFTDALLSFQVVFRSRAAELLLDPGAIEEAVTLGIGTMGQFGFSTKFVPGQGLLLQKALVM